MSTPARRAINVGTPPAGPYSHVVSAGGLIYLAGVVAEDGNRQVIGKGDVAAQTREVLDRLRTRLEAAGSSIGQVVCVTVYLKSASDFAAMNAAYRTYWPKDPPTRTTVIADLVLPDALIEIAMIAVPNGAERTVIQPSDWQPSPNPYSYGIRTGDTLFMSGLISRRGRDNSFVSGDVPEQTRVVLDSAGELLAAAGLTHANVVSARVFLPDGATFQQMNGEYRKYLLIEPSGPCDGHRRPCRAAGSRRDDVHRILFGPRGDRAGRESKPEPEHGDRGGTACLSVGHPRQSA